MAGKTYKGKKRKIRFLKKKPKKFKIYPKKKPTAKKNAKAISKLYKMSDPKFNYRMLNNHLVNSSTQFTQLELTNLAVSVPPATDPKQFLYRESDSVQARIRNIRIRFSVHAEAGREGGKIQKVWVALVKTTNGIGSTTGIHMPDVAAVFDPTSIDTAAGNLLAPWEGYQLTQGNPATGPAMSGPAFDSTTILKTWTCWLTPQGGDCNYNWETVTAAIPGPDITSSGAAPAGSNINYTADRVSSRYFTYTHNALNAVVKFQSATSDHPINVGYYLVALAQNSTLATGYRINATCKINFYDN